MLNPIKRFYLIICKKSHTIRAWQGHQLESKYFTVLNGSFEINLIKVDDWNNPSTELTIDKVILESNKFQTLIVPGGYVTGIQNSEQGASLLVYSDVTLEDSIKDDYTYDLNYWKAW